VVNTPESVVSYFEILDMVKSEFQLKDSYLRDGIPTFFIFSDPNIEEKMGRLRVQLHERGLDIILQKRNGELILIIGALRPTVRPKSIFSSTTLPLLLFIATVISVTVSGYLEAKSYVTLLEFLGKPIPSILGLTVLYTVSVIGVLGLHELGHMIACRLHNTKASLPLFIPGIPGITAIGTFGAVIRQESPRNRNQLFDIGFAGPLLGFIAAIIVSYFGYSWSLPVTQLEYLQVASVMGEGQVFLLPTIFLVLGRYILPSTPNSFTFFFHPIAWAGWVATLITFLNAFPIGQLDGGHITRAILGQKWHRLLSYIMIGMMVLIGWWPMAMLALFLIRTTHPGALDDVTKVTTSRKIAGILFALLFIACFTFSPTSPLFSLIFR
jgi:membrane-associated protease RseP (regulator of RpoE activity)